MLFDGGGVGIAVSGALAVGAASGVSERPQIWASVSLEGQSTTLHLTFPRNSSQPFFNPDVNSPQPSIISEAITSGKLSRSFLISPLPMWSKTLATSVTAASATSTIWLGNVSKMLITSVRVLTMSSGISLMSDGVSPFRSCSTKSLAASISLSIICMTLHGISEMTFTMFLFLDRRRPLMMVLLMF